MICVGSTKDDRLSSGSSLNSIFLFNEKFANINWKKLFSIVGEREFPMFAGYFEYRHIQVHS